MAHWNKAKMDSKDRPQKVVGWMINELLDHVEGDESHDNEEQLFATISTIIDNSGQNLRIDKRDRLLKFAKIVKAYMTGCAEFDQAKEDGDQAAMSSWQSRIEEHSEQWEEAAAFLNFAYAAEQLFKAKSLAEFVTILPSVPLDRTYSGGDQPSSAKSIATSHISPFPLVWAISARSEPLKRVQFMLAAGASLELKTELDWNVLHAMADMKRKAAIRLPIIRLLVFKGADLEARNLHNQTPLTVAIDRGSTEDVGHFLAAGAQVRKLDIQRSTHTPKKLRLILNHLADGPDRRNLIAEVGGWLRGQIAKQEENGKKAVQKGAKGKFHAKLTDDLTQSLAMISELPGYSEPKKDIKLNWQDEPSAFISVQTAGSLNEYRAALGRVDITTFEMAGDHPIYWPIRAKQDRLERLWLMLAAGASVKGASGDGDALHIFACESRKDPEEQSTMAHMLAQAGAELEALRYDGLTPLACAVASQNYVETAALLKIGSNANVTLKWNKTLTPRAKFDVPLIFAAGFAPRVFKLLLDHGASTQECDSNGRSIDEFLRETLDDHQEYLSDGNMSGNLIRRLKRGQRGLSKSLEVLEQS